MASPALRMNHLRASITAIRSSYWFVPTVMAVLAILLGALMLWVDVRLGSGWIRGISWYQQIRPDGAREMLSTIAGSMITVAGVVFSITIVALSYASSQYGPRVLTNFMSDRGNTVTLGTFIATFLYSLMVLRTIRGGDESFVPQYAVIVAMLLAICSIGVLIYFIHHVPQSMHINHVVARIGRQLVADAKTRFPEPIGQGRDIAAVGPPRLVEPAVAVPADTNGYVQSIDGDDLVELARKADVVIRLRHRPGDFVMAGGVMADVAPAQRWSDACTIRLRECFALGMKRTPEKDIMFLVSELVEIAARALSSGVNDPMTAMTCLDWLGAGGCEFASRKLPDAVREDADGVARLIAEPDGFGLFLTQGFGRLRQYVAGDEMVSLHFLHVLGGVAGVCGQCAQRDALRREIADFAEQARTALDGPGARRVAARIWELELQLSTAAPLTADGG